MVTSKVLWLWDSPPQGIVRKNRPRETNRWCPIDVRIYNRLNVNWKIGNSALAAALLLICAGALSAQSADDAHKRVYRTVVDSVVAVRALAPLGERSGSGVVLTKDGLLLTSYAVCPDGATNIRVWAKGPRLYTAEIVATAKKDELTLLRVKPRGELKPIELGESGKIRTG